MSTRRFILISTLLTLLVSAPLFLGGLLLPACYEDTFLGEFQIKIRRLQDTPGKRIIIIGGSGMAFAIDSTLLEEQFPDHQAVNLGMYADLGTKIILDLSKKYLHEGDIVILAPEQHEQTLSLHLGGRSALQALDGAWRLLFLVDPGDYGTLIGALPSFSLEKWRYFLSGQAPEGDGIYQRSSFNLYGDIESPLADRNVMSSGYDPTMPVSYDPALLSEDYVRYLNQYAAAAEKKGASVYFAFCPVNSLAVETSGTDPLNNNTDSSFVFSDADMFYDALFEALNFRILGNPNRSIMDAEWFYDTNFHLNQSGRIMYTRQLIRDIKAEQGITASTDIQVPQKPAAAGTEGTVITADMWAGQDGITTVSIPADTICIEDYAFSGCIHLKEIHILGSDPSRILIGEHLLDGTTALLYVPEGKLSAFRTNYRFSRYASRICEEPA